MGISMKIQQKLGDLLGGLMVIYWRFKFILELFDGQTVVMRELFGHVRSFNRIFNPP